MGADMARSRRSRTRSGGGGGLWGGQQIYRGGEADGDHGDGVAGVAADRKEDGGDGADDDDGYPGGAGQGHEAGILAEMSDDAATGPISGVAAEGALAYLPEMSPALRGAAILGPDGVVLAAAGAPGHWREGVATLFEVAARAGGGPGHEVPNGAAAG